MDDLLRSDNEMRRELGFGALEAMLQTSHFSLFQRFDFGGRSRDFGWFPRRRQDILDWYGAVLAMCASHDARDAETSTRIRAILSKHLWGLWLDMALYDQVDAICRQFHEVRFWPEGWTAIRSVRRYREESLPEEVNAKLSAIEKVMAPQSFEEQVRGQVLRNTHDAYDDIDFRDFEAQYARRESSLIELGKTMAAETEILDRLMPELFLCSTAITLGAFAKGLIDATSDRRGLWNRLIASFGLAHATERSPELLACYLYNLQSVDPELVETLLDQLLNNPLLSEWFPAFQGRVSISNGGLARLQQSLAKGSAPAERCVGLGGRAKWTTPRSWSLCR